MDNTVLYKLITELIDSNKRNKILKILQQEKGLKYPGFSKIEKVPNSLLLTLLERQERIKLWFLEYTVATYIVNKNDLEDISSAVSESNLPGVVAYLLLSNDEEKAKQIIEQYESEVINIKSLKDGVEEMQKEETMVEFTLDTDEFLKLVPAKFLGYIDYRTDDNGITYANFYPKFKVGDDSVEEISQPDKMFPQYGNFFIKQNRQFDLEEFIKNKEFVVVELNPEDVSEHKNSFGEFYRSYYQVDFENLLKQNKVHKLSDYSIYPIVNAEDSFVDFTEDKRFELMQHFPIGKYMTQALLAFQGDFYGPFEVSHRDIDNKNIIIYKASELGYSLNKYHYKDIDDNCFLSCSIDKQGNRIQEFIFIDSSVENDEEDLMDGEIVLKEFLKFSFGHIKNVNYSLGDIDVLVEEYKTALTSKWTQNEVADERLLKLKNSLGDIDFIQSLSEESISMISDALISNSENEQVNELLEKITTNPDFIKKIQSYRIVVEKTESAKANLDRLQEEYADFQENIEFEKKKFKEEYIDGKKHKIEELESEIKDKQEVYDQLLEKLQLVNDYEELKKEADYQERRKNHAEQQTKQLEDTIDCHLKELEQGLAKVDFDNEFDKYISAKLSKSFGKYAKENDDFAVKQVAELISKTEPIYMEDNEYLDYLVDKVRYYRPKYDRNTILNLFICLTQSFLTVFSGAPGTGKTSICNIMANVLGLTAEVQDSELFSKRYVSVSVERGWNSKRDLIGYYNPLSNRIEKTNKDLYDALKIIDTEGSNSAFPMVVLLDEANLSPMEYYWADFINLCDRSTSESHSIVLGGNEILEIPETLHFVATVNNDHTTETLSPRLIDRAFVVTLPNAAGITQEIKFDHTNSMVSWERLIKCFGSSKNPQLGEEALEIWNTISEKFDSISEPISWRSRDAVFGYCSIAQNIFEDEDGVDKSIVALDYAILQKVVPKISGNGPSYGEFLESLSLYCKKQNLIHSSNKISDILNRGKNAMNYYNYFD